MADSPVALAKSETPDIVSEYLTVDAEGVPVPQRMPTGEAMRSLLDECLTNDAVAAKYRASIQGLVNGNKPLDAQALLSAGQDYRSNWNDRQAESVIDAKCTADFNMLFDVARLIDIRFEPGFIPDQRVAQTYGAKIAQAYTYVVRNDPRFVEACQRAIRDRVELGLGFLTFPDKFDWRPKALRRGRCFFNDTASSDCSDLEFFMALDSITIAEAYAHIEKGEASEQSGWYIDRLKKALVDFFYVGASRKPFQDNYTLMMEDLELRIRSNDPIYYSKQYATFPVVHGFFQERSGKISQYMIAYSANSDAWLFESYEAFDSMAELVVPLPYDYGEGTLNSVKGLGHRIYAIMMESLRTLMHTLDTAKLSSSFILSNDNGAADLNYAIYRAGPTTILGKGFVPIQSSFAPNLQSSMAIRELLQRIANNNNGILRTQQEDTMGSQTQKTAEQVRVEASRDVKTENDRAFLTYLRWDELHRQIFNRLLSPDSRKSSSPAGARKSAQLFWDMCLQLGVPEVLLKKFGEKIRVTAVRSVGAGSTYTRQQNLTAMKSMTYNSMSEYGRRLIDMDLASIFVGQDNVGKYFTEPDAQAVPSNETTIATLENNDFKENVATVVGSDQLHAVHIETHLAPIMQLLQAFQQDPMSVPIDQAVGLLQQGIPHILKHIEYMSAEVFRKAQVEQYQKLIEQKIIPAAQQIIQVAEQAKQAQAEKLAAVEQENQQMKQQFSKENMEHEREMTRIQLKHEADLVAANGLNETRNAKEQQRMQQREQDFVQKAQIKQAAFMQEMTERQAKLQADMAKVRLELESIALKAQGNRNES